MANLLKRLQRGANTSPLWLIGLLLVFLIFRVKKSFSPMENDLLIQKILRGNGYSSDMARMIAAVARHESGNYTSPLFKAHNNFFGMKAANKLKNPSKKGRPHAQDYMAPGSMGYAGFNNPANSVIDLVLYLDYVGYPFDFDSPADLVVFMKSKGYFEADLQEYINGVERALPKVAEL